MEKRNAPVQINSIGIVSKDLFWNALAMANLAHEKGGYTYNFKTEKIRRKYFKKDFQ